MHWEAFLISMPLLTHFLNMHFMPLKKTGDFESILWGWVDGQVGWVFTACLPVLLPRTPYMLAAITYFLLGGRRQGSRAKKREENWKKKEASSPFQALCTLSLSPGEPFPISLCPPLPHIYIMDTPGRRRKGTLAQVKTAWHSAHCCCCGDPPTSGGGRLGGRRLLTLLRHFLFL